MTQSLGVLIVATKRPLLLLNKAPYLGGGIFKVAGMVASLAKLVLGARRSDGADGKARQQKIVAGPVAFKRVAHRRW